MAHSHFADALGDFPKTCGRGGGSVWYYYINYLMSHLTCNEYDKHESEV